MPATNPGRGRCESGPHPSTEPITRDRLEGGGLRLAGDVLIGSLAPTAREAPTSSSLEPWASETFKVCPLWSAVQALTPAGWVEPGSAPETPMAAVFLVTLYEYSPLFYIAVVFTCFIVTTGLVLGW